MKIGWVGLGKLGLPIARELAKSHDVLGCDIENRDFPQGSYREVVRHSEIVFVAVQTPHDPEYGGHTFAPYERKDFDYIYLLQAVEGLAHEAKEQKKPIVLVVVSTVLPGTYKDKISRVTNRWIRYVYNPFFIAMGSVVEDFLNPEFVLLGAEPPASVPYGLADLYMKLHKKPIFTTDVTTAELIKVAYNTYISMKIVFANTMMEISHKLGADVDDVSRALGMATDRITSERYLRGGMGDGGACHPRDNIAMSWLAERLDLSFDPFTEVTFAREDQTQFLADLIVKELKDTDLPLVLLGKSYKPEVEMTDGSPALLLAEILDSREIQFEHREK